MSAAADLHRAHQHAVAALQQYDRDPRHARAELVATVRVIAEALADYTPVRPPSSANMRAAHQSSSAFKAADVARILAEGAVKPPIDRGRDPR